MKPLLTMLTLLLAVTGYSQSQLTLPEGSPYSSATQRVGITDITVAYHSPAVRGRKIWGSIVPYNQLWRTGANENTTVSFTHEVSINNQKIPAGTYGLHTIPGEKEWTVIFSKNHTSWGSFFYKEEEDAARVNVTPTQHSFTEWLTFSFTKKEEASTTLALQWENLEVPVKIDVDVNDIVFQNIKNELRSTPGFTWEGYYNAANFCYNNNIHLDQATKWIGIAERTKPGEFLVLRLKSKLMKASGDSAGAETVMKTALVNATESDINTYGYELLNEGKLKQAIEVFKTNVKNYPKSWNAHDSLGEALAMSGDKNASVKEYEQALKNTPPADQKTRIEETIKNLKAGT